MPLTTEERAELLEKTPHVTRAGPAPALRRWVEDRREALLEELGSIPGFDTTRAIALRMLPALVADAERDAALAASEEALAGYPAAVADGDPMVLLARHPAWVGLAAWQIARLRGEASPDRAVELARAGFTASGEEAGRGEVLWALAETAEEAGWADDAAELLALAADGPFAREDAAAEVGLLLALAAAEADAPEADARLEALATASVPRVRTHARWVRAMRAREAGDEPRARALLEDALAEVDAEAEPDVADRIRAALARGQNSVS